MKYILLIVSVLQPLILIAQNNAFRPGEILPDDRGIHINAHGGGLLYHSGKYYWFGEYKGEKSTAAFVGVTCYSSGDLFNWKYEGVALPVVENNPKHDLISGCVLERPKVIYNEKTKKFVMYFHLELKGKGYEAARVGIAVGDKVTGPYTYLKSYRPNAGHYPVNMTEEQKNETERIEDFSEWWTPEWRKATVGGMFVRRDFAGGQMSRDMTLFVDDDGKAYHIYASEENLTLHLAELSDDYLSHTGKYIRIAPAGHNEAPAIFKKDGKYFMITSGCTGWEPNAARLFIAGSIWGPWTEYPNPCVGDDSHLTFHSQSAFIQPVIGKKDAFIFMADRWTPDNPIDSRYIWLPVLFENGLPVLKWFDKWDLDIFGDYHLCVSALAQSQTTIQICPDKGTQIINKNIYGHFAEHLGTCIYGGLWVGEDSPIPNTNGYRNDVLEALKKLDIPVLRWPGGCFADEYHWMDGIGVPERRPKMVNNNWGGTVEDNSFGTHEFLDLCEILGCEPYISGNVGSGTVGELAKWVEYMTSDGDSPMANLRRQNGREKAWKVKYLGIGNESWGCGGDMFPEYYSDLYRRYAVYCRNYDGNQLFKIASGASDYDYNWTEVLMKQIGQKMNGLSLHYYTVTGWDGSKGSATQFMPDEYYWIIGKCLEMEEVIRKHIAIMDKYDKEKRIALLVDEWGTWFDEEPGTIRGHLFQQNTMRDAFVAALTFHIFHKYTDRLQMANIAQVANVLQSMVLTKGDKMLLTPTYHVFEMYKAHQGAVNLPLEIATDTREIRYRAVPTISASASKTGDTINVTLANIDLEKEQEIAIDFSDYQIKSVSGRILTSKHMTDHNTFEYSDLVKPQLFTGTKISNGQLKVKMPAKSIVVLKIQ